MPQWTPQYQVGQRLLLAHGRFGEDCGTGLLGTAGQTNTGDYRIDPANRLDIEKRLINGAGEQQPRATDGQTLTVGTIAAIGKIQLTTGIEVIADMHAPTQVGAQAKAAERQPVLAHLDLDIHGDAEPLFGLWHFTPDHLRIAGDFHR